MALNIDLANGAINIYETGSIPRTYFGVIGASGKFYPSGQGDIIINNLPGSFDNLPGFRLVSNTLADLVDGDYNPVLSSTSIQFYISVIDGLIAPNYGNMIAYSASGFSIGDLITIQGSNLGGSGSITYEITALEINQFLISIGGDDYQIKWNDLIINGVVPESLQNAQVLLATLFSSENKSCSCSAIPMDLDNDNFFIENPGVYYVSSAPTNWVEFPSPTNFQGCTITIINQTPDQVTLHGDKPVTLEGADVQVLDVFSCTQFIAIQNYWVRTHQYTA